MSYVLDLGITQRSLASIGTALLTSTRFYYATSVVEDYEDNATQPYMTMDHDIEGRPM